MVNSDRRDRVRRAAFVEAVVRRVVQSPMTHFTAQVVQEMLEVSPEIAARVLRRLAEAGLLQEARGGVWVKVLPLKRPIPGAL